MEFLASDGQRELFAAARSVAESDVVQEAARRAMSILDTAPMGEESRAVVDREQYVAELVLNQSLAALAGSRAPFLRWTLHPGVRLGLDNPDNIYRVATLSDQGSYLIRGRRNTSTGAFFQFLDQQSGDFGRLGTPLTYLSEAQLVTDPDGTFTITVDASEPDGRANHLQLLPGSKYLVVRDTLIAWGTETPMELTIEVLHGPELATDHEQICHEAAEKLVVLAEFWLGYTKYWVQTPANTLVDPRPTETGGMTTQVNAYGWFDLQPDEALIVHVDPAEAAYLGFQLASQWFISINHWDRLGSLNNHQARPNPDGSISFVVSARDPGVWNWLDTDEHRYGLMFLRWQQLPPESRNPGPIHTEVVPVTECAQRLAGLGVPVLATDERQAQLEARFAAFERRPVPAELLAQADRRTHER